MYPRSEEVAELLPLVDADAVSVRNGTVFLRHAGMEIDLGGVGKEYAVDRAAEILEQEGVGSAVISFSGDVRTVGSRGDGRPWKVGVADPRRRGACRFAVRPLGDAGIATSGDYERGFVKDGVRYHHILDARTGWPVRGLCSATVVAGSAFRAGRLRHGRVPAGRRSRLRVARERSGRRGCSHHGGRRRSSDERDAGALGSAGQPLRGSTVPVAPPLELRARASDARIRACRHDASEPRRTRRRDFAIGLALWILPLVVVGVMVARDPSRRSVTPVFHLASERWWARSDLYADPRGYHYLPQFALLFAPFHALPKPLGDLALARRSRSGSSWGSGGVPAPQPGPASRAGAFSSLRARSRSVPRRGAQRPDQSRLRGALHAARREPRGRAAGRPRRSCLVALVALKPLGLVLVLLAPWVYRRILAAARRGPRRVRGAAVRRRARGLCGGAVPQRLGASLGLVGDDGEPVRRPDGAPARRGVDALASRGAGAARGGGLATLLLWWRAASRSREPWRALTLVLLGTIYLMLFNPMTEKNSYAIVAPGVRRRRRRLSRATRDPARGQRSRVRARLGRRAARAPLARDPQLRSLVGSADRSRRRDRAHGRDPAARRRVRGRGGRMKVLQAALDGDGYRCALVEADRPVPAAGRGPRPGRGLGLQSGGSLPDRRPVSAAAGRAGDARARAFGHDRRLGGARLRARRRGSACRVRGRPEGPAGCRLRTGSIAPRCRRDSRKRS